MSVLIYLIIPITKEFYKFSSVCIHNNFSITKCFNYIRDRRREYLFEKYCHELNATENQLEENNIITIKTGIIVHRNIISQRNDYNKKTADVADGGGGDISLLKSFNKTDNKIELFKSRNYFKSVEQKAKMSTAFEVDENFKSDDDFEIVPNTCANYAGIEIISGRGFIPLHRPFVVSDQFNILVS